MFTVKEEVSFILTGQCIPDTDDLDGIYNSVSEDTADFCRSLMEYATHQPYSVRTNTVLLIREILLRSVVNMINKKFLSGNVDKYKILQSVHTYQLCMIELHGIDISCR